MVSGFRLWPMMTGFCQLVLMRRGHNAAMTGRRTFLQTGLAAALLPAARSADAAPLPTNFPAQLQEALAKSLDDPKVAAKLAPVLLDVGFTWDAPSQPAAGFQTIVAYAFGNRPAAAGSTTPLPGPMNETLAKAVIEAQRKSGAATIYAQWEIASFLTEQKGIGKVVAINSVVAADGSVKYLSTDGVAEAIVTMVGGDAKKLGRVCVIGHHDHSKRCVETSRARGMDAWVMEGLPLPVNYDAESDQAWTRDREIYLIHDMFAQLGQIRATMIAPPKARS